MQVVKRLGVFSLGKLMGITYACLGLLFMPFFLLAGGMAMLGAQGADRSAAIGGGIGMVIMAIMFPFIYGLMGFVGGMISALIYNLAARFIGGIQIELVPAEPRAMAASGD